MKITRKSFRRTVSVHISRILSTIRGGSSMGKKKVLILSIFAVFLVVAGIFLYQSREVDVELVSADLNDDNVEDIVVDVSSGGFSTFEEMEAGIPIIVVGQTTKPAKLAKISSLESDEGSRTFTEFKIKEVVKNESSLKIEKNAIITVLEHEYFDQSKNANIHESGYQLMKQGKKYVLYLKYYPDENFYYIAGVTQGKIPLETKEIEIMEGKNADVGYNSKIIKKAQEKFKDK